MSNKSKETQLMKERQAVVETPIESVYSAAELIENYKHFKTSREIVIVALRLAGKESATFPEAKRIVENFRNKEVH